MMYLKKYPFQLIVVGILFLIIVTFVYISSSYRQQIVSNTTSYIEILEIGGDDNYPWAIVKNPYDSKATTFKLYLENYNTKNLLVVGDTYLATFETNLNTNKVVLIEIKQSAKPYKSNSAK